MENNFNFKEKEEKIYKEWENGGHFKCKKDDSKKPFVIAMPPPNITGKLHMGHALDNTIQDIFVRYNRMKNVPTLWVPGTDHASIATEAKVVQKLKAQGKTKDELGRDKFLDEVWAWKDEFGGEITKQLRKIGTSCDWEKEKFTMDKNLSKAVVTVFEKLYNEGLIYRGERLVNWCPTCKTSISDIEVEYEEEPSFLWHIRYPVENSKDEYVVVATTRPETMLGDTAVAVNPKDERYTHLVGKRVLLPIVNKYIPIVADRYVDMEFGTGVVKITPAHDKNDFEVGKRHNLEIINLFNDDATLNENALSYQGMTREEARAEIVNRLKAEGFLVKEEPYSHNVGKCYRCHNTIEPYMSNQWFVKMETLAKPAIEAVRNGEIKFIPKRFEKNFFNWMENIEDWCISRQLWWGHRIPAYYCDKCDKITVSKENIETCECGGHLTQDEDTLDTWFSSALWPFSIFGWPEDNEEYNYFYPTSTLVTGYDIIPFWVSKMIFSGIAYTGKIPFENVYIHGLVRDSQGRKMSKSLGNGVDPLDVIDQYGADALRFSLIQNISAGNDIRYIPEKVEASRNFANKLWNAAKFATLYINDLDFDNVDNVDKFCPEDKWILDKLTKVQNEVTENIDKFEIGIVLSKLYDFVWSDICDSYIEMVKPRLYNKEDATYKIAVWTLNHVLVNSVKLLHPYMPFITEEIYSNLKHESGMLIDSAWPTDNYNFEMEQKTVADALEIIKNIRNLRAENDIPNSKKLDIQIHINNQDILNIVKKSEGFIVKMAGIEKLEYINSENEKVEGSILIKIDNLEVYVDISNTVDKEAKVKKLQDEKKKAESELKRAEGMLSNEAFVAKAPEALIAKEKEKKIKYEELLEKINKELSDLI